jgi:hypothetical protein
MRLPFAFVTALGAAQVFACSSSDPGPGASNPDGTCADLPASFRFDHGGDGHGDPFGAKAAGQARAGKIIDPAQIVQREDARHKVRVGDFAMANDQIAVYIEAEGESDGYFPFGGELLAIEPVGEDGRPRGVSRYGESVLTLGLQTIAPDRVTVLADGSDGQAAIVRVSGVLKTIPFLETFRILAPVDYDLPAAVDYVLEPGSSEIKVRLSIANTAAEDVDFVSRQYLGFFHKYASPTFTDGRGYGEAKGETPYVAWDGGDSAFLVKGLLAPLRTELEISGFQMFSTSGLAVDACAQKTVDYVAFVSGGPGIDGLLEAKRRADSEPAWRELRGVVREEGAAPVAGALVHATTADGRYLTRTRTSESGAFVLHVPPGGVQLTPTLAGWAMPDAVAVADGAGDVELTLPRRATLIVDATDSEDQTPLPVRVQVIPSGSVARAPASHGVRYEARDRLWQGYATAGRIELPVPPGSHRVIVSRGYEYELSDTTVEARAGETTNVEVELTRTVDSTGVMCADFHIHSAYSVDSGDPVDRKVEGAIVDGLEIPVSSEHEYIIDFEPVIQRLGLGKWAFGMASEELTTFTWGHYGVVPIAPRPESVNNGAIAWVGKKPAEIFATVNELPEQPVLIINHPSGGGFGAYFSQAGLDRATGTGNPDLWSDDFAAIEVFNDSDFEENRTKSVEDWFALLNAGKTYWAVGSSDSHDQRTSPVGYPRTCLHFGHDDPRQLTPEKVRDVLRAGTAVISGGLFMTVSGPGGVLPGGTASAGQYRVVVQAPGWLGATTLEVIVDGVSSQTIPLTAVEGIGAGKRYEATVDVAAASSRERHWVVFHAKGEGDLGPLHPGRTPFAASNPIFF